MDIGFHLAFYHPLKIITKSERRRNNVTSRLILFITVVVVKRTKMNDLEKIIAEIREDRDIWREIGEKLQTIEYLRERKFVFEIREGDTVIVNNLESLFKLIEGHGRTGSKYIVSETKEALWHLTG